MVQCHIGSKNSAYCIFDTKTEMFVEDLIGNHLTWYRDDLTTAVYAFWSDICAYDSSVIKTYDLPEDVSIHGLAFSDDHTKLRVTLLHMDGTEELDVIEL